MGKKIYGYDEELWVRLLTEHWESGERDSERIIRVLREFGASNVIDLGCGIGRISLRLASKGYRVFGIDISELCIKKARSIAEELGVSDRVEFTVGDYRKLEEYFGGRTFDVALCIHSRAWEDVSDASSFFSKLRNHVKDRGVFVLQDVCRDLFFQAVYTAPTSLNWFRITKDLLLLSNWKVDFLTSRVSTVREVYEKVGDDLKFLSRVFGEYYMFSISDYAQALTKAGWEVVGIERVAKVDLNDMDAYSNDPWFSYSFQIVALKSNTTHNRNLKISLM